jgi:hypothetical protein
LSKEYAQKIKVIETKTFNSAHIEIRSNQIKNLTTGEGVRISADEFIDANPESIIAEKSGIGINIETPNLAYGMVFDIEGIGSSQIEQMQSSKILNPIQIIGIFNISLKQVFGDPVLKDKFIKLNNALSHKTFSQGEHASYGYEALASAYDLFMECKARVTQNDALKARYEKLNGMRVLNGFNISFRDGVATLNGLSYQNFAKIIKQNDHSLSEKQFADINEIELTNLQQFFSVIFGMNEFKIRPPEELYVRQSTASFKTTTEYDSSSFTSADDLDSTNNQEEIATYGFDNIGQRPRDQYDHTIAPVKKLQADISRPTWKIEPETACTSINNLYLISKNAGNPISATAMRIIEIQMRMAVELIEYIH